MVALANLHPESKVESVNDGRRTPTATQGQGQTEVTAEEDIDSFMYQTIGHSVIPLYESALGIPLYRAPITGGAVDTARIYRHDAVDQFTENLNESESNSAPVPDETESLVPLLRRIQEAHPEANAVSAGAILSTYQRTRIENVASRLGLTPLAWLWMYPTLPAPELRVADSAAVAEAGLLEDMAGVGCDARVIKVASGGLDERYLWENVSGAGDPGRAVRRRIVKAMGRFADKQDVGGAVLGEGGEYETLAVDGPGFLWKKGIDVEMREVRCAEGGVAFLTLMGATCVEKVGGEVEYTPEDVRRPALLDGSFASVLAEVFSLSLDPSNAGQEARKTTSSVTCSIAEPCFRKCNSTWIISNLTAPEAGPNAADQMNGIIAKVQAAMKTTTHSTDDIVFATVLLNSMADFGPMNNIYVSLFKKPNPPARVTVACGDTLPSNVKVMVSFIVDLGPRTHRQGLHVQSRSYWAPANIGPYSQAISIPLQGESRVIYIAGQIPLDPASMELASTGKGSWLEDYSLRAVLSLQHLWRIGHAMQVYWWLGGIAFLTGSQERIQTQVQVAWYLWKKMHTRADEADGEDDKGPQLDAWDIKYGRKMEEITSMADSPSLPRFDVFDDDTSDTISPFFAVEVDELPRGSDIEWQGLGARCERIKLETKEDSVSATLDETYRYTGLEIDISETSTLEITLRDVMDRYGQGRTLAQAVLYTAASVPEGFWAGQVVPCRSVWGRGGRRLTAGVVLQVEVLK